MQHLLSRTCRLASQKTTCGGQRKAIVSRSARTSTSGTYVGLLSTLHRLLSFRRHDGWRDVDKVHESRLLKGIGCEGCAVLFDGGGYAVGCGCIYTEQERVAQSDALWPPCLGRPKRYTGLSHWATRKLLSSDGRRAKALSWLLPCTVATGESIRKCVRYKAKKTTYVLLGNYGDWHTWRSLEEGLPSTTIYSPD